MAKHHNCSIAQLAAAVNNSSKSFRPLPTLVDELLNSMPHVISLSL
jgi:hypothetical protein